MLSKNKTKRQDTKENLPEVSRRRKKKLHRNGDTTQILIGCFSVLSCLSCSKLVFLHQLSDKSLARPVALDVVVSVRERDPAHTNRYKHNFTHNNGYIPIISATSHAKFNQQSAGLVSNLGSMACLRAR